MELVKINQLFDDILIIWPAPVWAVFFFFATYIANIVEI